MHFQNSSSFFNILNEQLKQKNAFALYCLPNSNTINAVLQESADSYFVNTYTEKGFVMAPFNNASKTILIKSNTALSCPKSELKKQLPQTPILLQNKQRHLQLVQKGINAINNGTLAKVVLSRKAVTTTTTNPFEIYANVVLTYNNAFCYMVYHPNSQVWIGASPEQFLKISKNILQTNALAGTLPVIDHKPPLWTNKEIEEQAMVTNYIVTQLHNGGVPTKRSKTTSIKAGKLWHLNTSIKANIENHVSIHKIINTLHPTPAVCGLPVQKAKEFISNNEGYNREFYTGFLGLLNVDSQNLANLFVNLRCLKIVDNQINIYVGGGITASSDPQAEWLETVNKSKTMLDVL